MTLDRSTPGTLILPDARIYDDTALVHIAYDLTALLVLDAYLGGIIQRLHPPSDERAGDLVGIAEFVVPDASSSKCS